VAKVLGLDESQVTVHVTLLGGGFGRKSKPDYVVEAALVARQMNAPVRLQWTREDEVQHDYFHTTSAQRLVAGLDGAGKVTAWLHRTAFPPIASTFKAGETHGGDGELGQGVLDIPLAIPNVQAENGEARAHVRIGWMRSVNNIHHAFAMSSFIDELAHARGADPKAMVLEIMGPPRNVTEKELGVAKLPNYGASLEDHPVDVRRMRHVVERVTEMAGWAKRGADASRGLLDVGVGSTEVLRNTAAPPLPVGDDRIRLAAPHGPCGRIWVRPHWDETPPDGAKQVSFCENADARGAIEVTVTRAGGHADCSGIGSPTRGP
jgi:isoquinoline 1-oxidoreductase beta subunit